MGISLERRFGFLLATASILWAAYHSFFVAGHFDPSYVRLGPMQLCMAGLMLWLHGKHRNSTNIHSV